LLKDAHKEGLHFVTMPLSIMKVVASEIRNIFFTKANESLHLGMSLHHVRDHLGYLIHKLKDWHETMITHKNVCKQRFHE
jgi:TFIIF-interacting CTD phosphatase-like protein